MAWVGARGPNIPRAPGQGICSLQFSSIRCTGAKWVKTARAGEQLLARHPHSQIAQPRRGDVIPNTVENRHLPKSENRRKSRNAPIRIVQSSTEFGINRARKKCEHRHSIIGAACAASSGSPPASDKPTAPPLNGRSRNHDHPIIRELVKVSGNPPWTNPGRRYFAGTGIAALKKFASKASAQRRAAFLSPDSLRWILSVVSSFFKVS